MIGRDREKQAELHAARMSIRAERLEETLLEKDEQMGELRRRLALRERQLRHLASGIRDLAHVVDALADHRAHLATANLKVDLLPPAADGVEGNGSAHNGAGSLPGDGPTTGPGTAEGRPDLQLDSATSRLQAVLQATRRLVDGVGADRLAEPTDAVEVLLDQVGTDNVEVRAASEADSVADVCRLWVDADSMARYQRELLVPYVDVLVQALDEQPGEQTVLGAKCALPLLKEAFRDSTTYLLRRNADLDDYAVEATARVDRLGQDPMLALDRMATVIDQVRARGAVDFFHNLHHVAERAVREGTPGAGAAAWLLSDATVALLTDEGIKAWIATGMT